jgi:phosphatidate cytidylyltransferase
VLRDRLFSAAVLIAVASISLWLDVRHPLGGVGGVWLLPLLLFFALGTAFDLATMLRASGQPISRRSILCGTGLVSMAPAVPMLWPLFGSPYPEDCPLGVAGWVLVGVVAAVFLVLLVEMRGYRAGANLALPRTLNGVFASVYVGVPMALLVMVRQLEGPQMVAAGDPSPAGDSASLWGVWALISLIAATKSSDAGAYFVGKMAGRRKLIPRLSPGKTWEGAIGGIATAVAVSYGCAYWMIPQGISGIVSPPWWGPALFGTACAMAGMAGDLAESMVKRETGVKDSGHWLPGLGGVWDVTDSLIGAVMPAWVLLAAGMLGS